MAHTKGPWRIGKYTNSVISDNKNGLEINGAIGEEAVKYYGGNLICESVSIENAKLIAAAPDLLEALNDMIEMYEQVQPVGGWQGVYDSAIYAIKKATE